MNMRIITSVAVAAGLALSLSACAKKADDAATTTTTTATDLGRSRRGDPAGGRRLGDCSGRSGRADAAATTTTTAPAAAPATGAMSSTTTTDQEVSLGPSGFWTKARPPLTGRPFLLGLKLQTPQSTRYSTVTDFARLRGWSTSAPFWTAT